MSIFSPDDYKREAEKNLKKENKPKKAHWEVKHRNYQHFKKELFWCPILCQQKDNGGKGKKTFDGKTCKACGYEKKVSGS
jgi:hypothetical protein